MCEDLVLQCSLTDLMSGVKSVAVDSFLYNFLKLMIYPVSFTGNLFFFEPRMYLSIVFSSSSVS